MSALDPVIYPLMPKGVEHSEMLSLAPPKERVIYPLMPKGVEHLTPSGLDLRHCFSDLSVDAERR